MSTRKPKSIEARSIVSGRDLEPYVQIVLMYDDDSEDQITQWTPAEAYNHAMAVLGAVEAANADAFLLSFLTQTLCMPFEDTGAVLQEFRAWREHPTRRKRDSEDQITQWTPAEAYNHAMAVLGAVEAANADAFLLSFLTQTLCMPFEDTGAVLQEFRAWREHPMRRKPTTEESNGE